MKKKYLFLINGERIGGGERHQIDYFQSIDYEKYAVTLGTRTELINYFKALNLPIEVVLFPSFEPKDGFLKKFSKFYAFFNIYKPDCVVLNQYWLKSFGLPELMAALLITKGNAVMIVHDCPPVYPSSKSRLFLGFIPGLGLSWRKERLLQTMLGYFARYTIAVSKSSRDTLVRLHGFPSSKVKVIYHGININKFLSSSENRAIVRREYNIVDSDIVIISTASLWLGKRIDRLINAFAILAEERKDIQLLIIGDGPEKEKLISLVKSFNDEIQKRIKFLGFQDNVLTFLQMSDIYVLPSDSEGLSIACLEAMSCGLISVMTDCSGSIEIIKDGCNGFLVEKNDEGVLKGLKKALHLTAEEKIQICKFSLNDVASRFNLKTNIQKAFEILKLNLSGG